MRRSSLICLLLVSSAFRSWAPPAAAAPATPGATSATPQTAHRLSDEVLRTLDLSSTDRDLVKSRPGRDASSQRQLRGLVRRLAETATWKAAILAEALEPVLSEGEAPTEDKTSARLRDAVDAMKAGEGACGERQSKLAQRAGAWSVSSKSDTGKTILPIPFFTSAAPNDMREPCSTGAIPSDGQALLTIPARRGYQVSVQILAPTFRLLDQLPSIELDELRRPTLKRHPEASGWAVFFAAVPRDSRVLVIERPKAGAPAPGHGEVIVPSVRVARARDDNELLPDSPACLDVSRLQRNDNARSFVNGVLLPAGTETVTLLRPDEGATVQVYPPGSDRQSTGPSFVRELSGARLVGRTTCASIEGDATESSRKTVLVSATAGDGCARAGIDPLKLRAEIERLLPDSQYQPAGANVADLLKIVDEFQSRLKALGSGALNDQALDATADIARGLRDVGFSIALTADVRCIEEPGHEIQFTVAAQRIDLEAVAEAARKESRKDRVDGMKHVLSSQIETQQGAETLRGLLAATISRLFDLPYLRLTTGAAADWQKANVKLAFEGWAAGQAGATWKAKLKARKIDDSDTPALVQCHDISEENLVRRVGTAAAPTDGKRYWVEETDVILKAPHDEGSARSGSLATSDGASASRAEFVLPFFPVEPGLYAVHATLAPAPTDGGGTVDSSLPAKVDDGEIHVDVCARVEEKSYAFWTQLIHLENIFKSHRAWADVRSTTTYMLFGAQRYASETRTVSALVGLGYSFFEAPAPPGWDALARSRDTPGMTAAGPALVFDGGGNSPFSWTRLSIAASLQLEWRLIRLADLGNWAWWRGYVQRSWARTSAFYLTITPLLDLGWYLADGVPAEFRRNTNHPFDVDGSVLMGLSYRVLLADHQILSLGGGVGWLGFDDFGSADGRRRSTIVYDNLFAWYFGVGFGWAP